MDALVRRLAKRSRITHAQAADQIDGIVHDLVKKLKRGEAARIPGFGRLVGNTPVVFKPEGSDRARRK